MNWSTFVLEILNFLVLVWILKRFLYKPVLDVIAHRKSSIDKTLADSKTFHAEAEKLREQYESRLSDWDHERQRAREELAREIELERAQQMAELQTLLEEEREKTRVTEERRHLDALNKMEESALLHGARFATYLLREAAGPDTETRLIDLALEELRGLPAERISVLRNSYLKTSEDAVIESAFPIPDSLRLRLEEAMQSLAGPDISPQFEQNSELLAGVQITIGAWILSTNLRDELKGFAALAHGE